MGFTLFPRGREGLGRNKQSMQIVMVMGNMLINKRTSLYIPPTSLKPILMPLFRSGRVHKALLQLLLNNPWMAVEDTPMG